MSSTKPYDGQIPLMMRTGFNDPQFDYLMECATRFADRVRETEMAPIQAMLTCLMAFALTGATCHARRDDLMTIVNDNMDELLRIANEHAAGCPVLLEEALEEGWRLRRGVPRDELDG